MPNSPTGRGWVTIFDHDFTADATQTLSPDGLYTLSSDSSQWQKFNSANDSVAMKVTAGTGLVVQPVANTNYGGATRTLPGIWLPLSGIAGFQTIDWVSGVRLWFHVAAYNGAASFDEAVAALDTGTFGAMAYQLDRGISTAGTGHQTFTLQEQIAGTAITGGTGFISGNDLTLGGANNVGVLTIPHLMATTCYASFGGFGLASGKTWPDPQDLQAICMSAGNVTGYSTFTVAAVPFNIQPTLFGIMLGAKRQNSATALSVTYGHVRLDVKI